MDRGQGERMLRRPAGFGATFSRRMAQGKIYIATLVAAS